jgi:hypothetical protein
MMDRRNKHVLECASKFYDLLDNLKISDKIKEELQEAVINLVAAAVHKERGSSGG